MWKVHGEEEREIMEEGLRERRRAETVERDCLWRERDCELRAHREKKIVKEGEDQGGGGMEREEERRTHTKGRVREGGNRDRL